MKTIDIVVPCYNEEEGLETFISTTDKVIDSLPQYSFRYLLINDGSTDKTYLVMKKAAEKKDNVKYISFSRNFGKEAAILAGLQHSDAQYVIVMDADLQHSPELFPEMIQAVENEGFDCCAVKRISRKGEKPMRKAFSKLFFKLSSAMTDISMPYGAMDYRILTRQMVNAILELSEVQRFSKGIFSWVGFNTKWLSTDTAQRQAGKSAWNFSSLFKYALDGIISFSVTPLRMIAALGAVVFAVSVVYIIITLIQTLFFGITVPGYVTTLCSVLFLGGLTQMSIGVLGEYIGRIYMETKKRPIYIIHHTNLSDDEKSRNEE